MMMCFQFLAYWPSENLIDELLQFVNFTGIMSTSKDMSKKEVAFALAALMEIPSQYKATQGLRPPEYQFLLSYLWSWISFLALLPFLFSICWSCMYCLIWTNLPESKHKGLALLGFFLLQIKFLKMIMPPSLLRTLLKLQARNQLVLAKVLLTSRYFGPVTLHYISQGWWHIQVLNCIFATYRYAPYV